MNDIPPTDSPIAGRFGTLIRAGTSIRLPDMELETQLTDLGFANVAGIDEVGRGPLAGPVVSAAVILNPNALPTGLDDSKKLSGPAREKLCHEILRTSHVGLSIINAGTIDAINIRQATLLSMTRAAKALAVKPDWCLVDGRDIPPALQGSSTAVIKGDGRSMSIAAASIVAKVVRDQIMCQAAKTYPQYGFEKHKGYGTLFHRQAITRNGPCPLHRRSFAPLKKK